MTWTPKWNKNLLNWTLNRNNISAFIMNLIKQYDILYFKNQKLESENRALNQLHEALKDDYKLLGAENLDLHRDHETFETRLENAKKSLELADHTNKVKSEELNEVHYTINSLMEENNQLSASNDIWIKQHESDQKKIKSLTNKLKKLESSKPNIVILKNPKKYDK